MECGIRSGLLPAARPESPLPTDKSRMLRDWAMGCARRSPHAHRAGPPSPAAAAAQSDSPAQRQPVRRCLPSLPAALRRTARSHAGSTPSPQGGRSGWYERCDITARALHWRIRRSSAIPLPASARHAAACTGDHRAARAAGRTDPPSPCRRCRCRLPPIRHRRPATPAQSRSPGRWAAPRIQSPALGARACTARDSTPQKCGSNRSDRACAPIAVPLSIGSRPPRAAAPLPRRPHAPRADSPSESPPRAQSGKTC